MSLKTDASILPGSGLTLVKDASIQSVEHSIVKEIQARIRKENIKLEEELKL